MKKRKIWIDCDPGIDDAVALAMVAASQDRLHVLGISTVSGNQTIDRVTENALKLSAFLSLNVPIVRGADCPLLRPLEIAGDIHGDTGLGNCRLPETQKKPEDENGLLFMRNTIMHLPAGEKVTLVPTGPLTNIALLFKVFPEVKERVEQIVLMGGSASGGNVTPYAEFNIWVDPEAASLVFKCGLPIVMCGLDVTMQSGLNHRQVKKLLSSSHPVQHAYGEMLSFYLGTTISENRQLVCIHDAVTILFLTNPELFRGIYAEICIDCSEEHRGQTILRPVSPEELSRISAPVYMLNKTELPKFQEILLQKLCSLA